MKYYSRLFKIKFTPCLSHIRLQVQANRGESLTFDQTSQIRLETSLIRSNYI